MIRLDELYNKKTDFNINGRIVELRQRTNISTDDLAKIMDVDGEYYKDIEKGNKEVPIKVLEKICNALGITLQAFFTIEEP
jgi:transcriptional regulator with XRE-family HTH domain